MDMTGDGTDYGFQNEGTFTNNSGTVVASGTATKCYINFTGSGYSGNTAATSAYFNLDLDGSSNTMNITQASTLARDWLSVIANTSNSNICIVQNDGGTATSC